MDKANTGLAAELSARRVLVDGALYSGAIAALVLATLRYDPQIWHQDYPEEMKAKFGPPSEKARRLTAAMLVPFLVIAVGGLVMSNLRLKRDNGGRLSFAAAFANAYAVFTTFNLFDTVILDYWLFTLVQPRWSKLPGTEDMDMRDYAPVSSHAAAFGKGVIWGLIVSLPVAFFTSRGSQHS
jgi:hypothetical protein